MLHKNRVLISYDGKCPFRCKHCYTFSLDCKENRTIEEILSDIKHEKFDIVYVSQKNENFVNQNDGILLCEKTFECYNTDIVMITRNVLDDIYLKRLHDLSERMKENGNQIIVAVSFISLNHPKVSERLDIVPTPQRRIKFLNKLHDLQIPNFALIRPVFPKEIIPIEDIECLIDECKKYVNCIVASELGVNSDIEKRLGINFDAFCSYKSNAYLNGAIDGEMKFLQLDEEMLAIAQKCEKENIKFFTHSMQAINYICEEG